MGGILSRISLRLFELCNELFVGVASGVVGATVLTLKSLVNADYSSTLFVIAVTAGSLLYIFQNTETVEPSGDKIVFITGCDSGLGYSLAQHVGELGFSVVAACHKLNSKGAKELKKNPKIILVELDITNEEQVHTAVETVGKYIESHKHSLYAVINNAGCMVFGEFEWLTRSLVEQQIKVNLLGTLMLTKSFCPLLRKYKARLIIINSHCGLSTLPGLSIYGATKAGLLAWCDGLRVELNKYGVSVVSFVPGSFVQHSNIMSRHDENVLQMSSGFTLEQRRFYGDYFRRYNAYLSNISGRNAPEKIPDPQLYAKFDRALLEARPKALYVNEIFKYRLYHTVFKYAPTWIRDYATVKFMQMPEYREDCFVPDALA